MRVLLIEDEPRLADSLRRGLEEEGYEVESANDLRTGEQRARQQAHDVLIIDRRLPDGDGLALVRRLREAGMDVPVLMLTALGEPHHRVEGLDAGADDYLPKPFSFDELLARLRALLRRAPRPDADPVLRLGALALNTDTRRVALGDAPLALRPKEFALLTLFLRRPEYVYTRHAIAEQVWGEAFYVTDNTLDVTVSGLRQALDSARPTRPKGTRPVIETVRGVGYRIRL